MRRAIHAFKEALDRVRSGAAPEEVVRLPSGDQVRLVHDSRTDAGYRIEPLAADGGPLDPRPTSPEMRKRVEALQGVTRSLVFRAEGRRPSDYPSDLPFLPGHPVSFMEMGSHGSRLLAWARLYEPDEALHVLRTQLADEGWVLVRDATQPAGVLNTVGMMFRKGGIERFFLLTGMGEYSRLMMREYRRGPDADRAAPRADEAG